MRALLLFPIFVALAHGLPQESRNMPSGRIAAASEPALLDINTASLEALRALPGMGMAYARRIVEGRPFVAKNQLVTRGILPEDAYARIRDQIVAHRLPKP